LLNHGITSGGLDNSHLGAGMGEFIEQYIFPGGGLLHARVALYGMAHAGLGLVGTENLRPHYARTLWAWSDALEAVLEPARQVLLAQAGADRADKALRAYRLYLAGSALGFERGWMALHQILAVHPDGDMGTGTMTGAQSVYPFTRDYIYNEAPSPCFTSSSPEPRPI
jgi:cyclopropane-fatty-acyl-phospholipid synthase